MQTGKAGGLYCPRLVGQAHKTSPFGMNRAPNKGRPRIEDRAKTIEACKPWLKLECRVGHGIGAKPEAASEGGLMAEDAAPLIDALVAIIEASRAYLPPDGIGKDEFITRVLEAVDNPRIIAALAAHGHPVAG